MQVTELLGSLRIVGGPTQLVGLLGDLVEHAIDRRPVIAEVGGPLLHLLACGQRRHRRADPVEGPAVRADTGFGAVIPVLGDRRSPFVGLDPLPLAVHVGRRPCDRVAEDMWMAADDLGCDRRLDVGQVEDAGLGRQLRVQDDLEPQVAELTGELRSSRRPRARRRPRTPPRGGACAATCGSARDPTGSHPAGAAGRRSRASPTAPPRPAPVRPAPGTASRPGRRHRATRPSRHRDRRTDRPDGRPGRAAAGATADRARRARAARERRGTTVTVSGAQDPKRDDQQRARRLDRGADERLARDDLEAVRRIESPAKSRLRDERVEHPPSR